MADQQVPQAAPDYELDDVLGLSDPKQYAALFEDTRQQIVQLLLDRAATTTELAQALQRPKGTIGHHLSVLADAGLVRVVRTKRVRALEAKYYGRTARVFIFRREHDAVGVEARIAEQAASEIAEVDSESAEAFMVNARYVRIPADRAKEWARRLQDLLVEFAEQPREGDQIHGMLVAVFPTSRASLQQPGGEGA